MGTTSPKSNDKQIHNSRMIIDHIPSFGEKHILNYNNSFVRRSNSQEDIEDVDKF